MRAVYHLFTNQLRAEFDQAPPERDRCRLAAEFRWHHTHRYWFGTWTPAREDLLRELGIATIDIDDEPDDVEGRLARYEELADRAQARADEAHRQEAEIGDIIPMGQPVLVGHHSERAHRRIIARLVRLADRQRDELEKADYWRARLAGAERRARLKHDPAAIYRRLEALERDERRKAREIDEYGAPYSSRGYGLSPQQRLDAKAHAQRWLDHFRLRLAYERALYEASGGIVAATLVFEVGGGVRYNGTWYEVAKVNRKTVTVRGWLGRRELTYNVTLDGITESMPAAAWLARQPVAAPA